MDRWVIVTRAAKNGVTEMGTQSDILRHAEVSLHRR